MKLASDQLSEGLFVQPSYYPEDTKAMNKKKMGIFISCYSEVFEKKMGTLDLY